MYTSSWKNLQVIGDRIIHNLGAKRWVNVEATLTILNRGLVVQCFDLLVYLLKSLIHISISGNICLGVSRQRAAHGRVPLGLWSWGLLPSLVGDFRLAESTLPLLL